MKLIDMQCPHCGAHLKVDIESKQAACEHCGANILIDDEVQHVQYDNAEEAGYKFEKGRQRAQAEERRRNQQEYESYSGRINSQQPKKRRTWLWVLGWFFIFPVPLTILMLRKKDMKPAIKYGIIAAGWIIYLAIGLSGGNSGSTKNNEENINTSEAVGSVDNKSSEDTNSVSESKAETDYEIVLRDGHPKYYGSTSAAHSTWDDVEKGKIVFADSYDRYSDKTILLMAGYAQGEKNELISDIEIYFNNFTQLDDVDLNTALDVAQEYLPNDIIQQWYQYKSSKKIVPIEDSEKETYYVISYALTEDGSSAYYAKEHPYSGTIDVIIRQAVGGNIDSLTIGFGTPRWMSSLEQNGYKTEDWSYNFFGDTAESQPNNDASTEGAQAESKIDRFVSEFNSTSETQLVFVEEFTPNNRESGHYRTEFRLNAYDNAIGKSFDFNGTVVEIIERKPMIGDTVMRVYMDGATLDQCKELLTKAAPIMDETATSDDVQEAVEYISERKEANGYYFANLGLLLLGNDNKGYEFMLKMGND